MSTNEILMQVVLPIAAIAVVAFFGLWRAKRILERHSDD